MLEIGHSKITEGEVVLFEALLAREFELIHLREMMGQLLNSSELELCSDSDGGLKLIRLLALRAGASESMERIEDFYIEATYKSRKEFKRPSTTKRAAKTMVEIVINYNWKTNLSEALEIFDRELFGSSQSLLRNIFSNEGASV